MRLFIKAFFPLLIFLLTISLFVKTSSAQTPTPTIDPNFDQSTVPPQADTSREDVAFTIEPPLQEINESKESTGNGVKITFNNLTAASNSYYLCTGAELCIVGTPSQDNFGQGIPAGLISTFTEGGFIKLPNVGADGKLTITVCGDGKDRVKLGPCSPTDDYFHGGNLYAFSVGIANNNVYYPSENAGFYVARAYPSFNVLPNTGLTTNGTLNVTIGQSDKYKPGGNNNNNYQVLVNGPGGYYGENCVTLKENDSLKTIKYDKLLAGRYLVTLKERVNEPKNALGILGDIKGAIFIDNTSLFGIPLPDPLAPLKIHIVESQTLDRKDNDCQGGFTYYHIVCEVKNPNTNGGTCSKPEADPEGAEYQAFLKELSELNKIIPGAAFPCGDGTNMVSNPGTCPSINTAIGPIEVSVDGFIESIFRLVLMLAGFGAVIIIIYSGYLLMISRGDKEKIAAARETITAAVVGLLFIILSIVILEVIGIDLLKIPGLTR